MTCDILLPARRWRWGKVWAMIGKLLGHTQVQTTARYAHLTSTPAISVATEVSNNIYGLLEMKAI